MGSEVCDVLDAAPRRGQWKRQARQAPPPPCSHRVCLRVGLSPPPFRLSFCLFAELSVAAGGLSTTPMSPSAVSAQSLLMSSSGVGGEASVTLTLADTQGLLSGALDTVTLNIASQVGAVSHAVQGDLETSA